MNAVSPCMRDAFGEFDEDDEDDEYEEYDYDWVIKMLVIW